MQNKVDSSIVKNIVSLLESCTEDFAFVYDIAADTFFISERALAHFNLPGMQFSGAVREIIALVHEEERIRCNADIEAIIANTKPRIKAMYHLRNRYGEYVSAEIKMQHLSVPPRDIVAGTLSHAARHSFFEDDRLASKRDAQFDFDTARMAAGSLSGFAMQIEVDNFISISKHAGFEVGKEILAVVSDACKLQCVNGTKAYLLSGNKFLLINFDGGNADEILRIYSSIKQSIREAEYESGYERVFTVSVGGIAFINDTSTLTEMLAKLIFTVESGKNVNKDTLSLFNAREYANYLRALEIESAMRDSIKNKFEGFTLLFQPIVNAKAVGKSNSEKLSKIVVGAESLLRWKNERFGTVGAGEFIPILERSGLIVPVGRWVLIKAFAQCAAWNTLFPELYVSVNISFVQILQSNLVSEVQIALERTKVNPKNIVLEITESGNIDDEEIQSVLAELLALGVKIDIDDFGTGFSNLRYLQDIHANTLKLDYTFIQKALTGDMKDLKIIEFIVGMAHALGMTVCMEGIESYGNVEKLLPFDPDKFQGYLFSRPVDARTFAKENLHT
ncbi:EAL domain-containing protein [Treponema socranskii]|uniref:EAL domain-containing protein n=1 Tax=Treponema socranskii TaxID=53419 RepID=UPI003D6DFC1E